MSIDIYQLVNVESCEVLWDYCLENNIAAPNSHSTSPTLIGSATSRAGSNNSTAAGENGQLYSKGPFLNWPSSSDIHHHSYSSRMESR